QLPFHGRTAWAMQPSWSVQLLLCAQDSDRGIARVVGDGDRLDHLISCAPAIGSAQAPNLCRLRAVERVTAGAGRKRLREKELLPDGGPRTAPRPPGGYSARMAISGSTAVAPRAGRSAARSGPPAPATAVPGR